MATKPQQAGGASAPPLISGVKEEASVYTILRQAITALDGVVGAMQTTLGFVHPVTLRRWTEELEEGQRQLRKVLETE